MDVIDDPISNTMTAIFELPGIKTSDVTLQIREGKLIVAGRRRAPQAVLNILTANQGSLPRNPVSTADSLAAGDMEMENQSPNPLVQLPVSELRFGEFYRAIPVPEGLKVCAPCNSTA